MTVDEALRIVTNEKRRVYYAKNRERIRERENAYVRQNKVKINARRRQLYSQNPEQYRNYVRKRRGKVQETQRPFGTRVVSQTGGGICEGAFLG